MLRIQRGRHPAGAILAALVAAVVATCSASPTGPASSPDPGVGGTYVDVSPGRLTEMLAAKDFTFVNVHIPYEGEIKATDLFLPFDQIDALVASLPERDAKIVLYCRSGSMSTAAAGALVAAGYTNVWNLDGGMIAWQAEGYTIIDRPPD